MILILLCQRLIFLTLLGCALLCLSEGNLYVYLFYLQRYSIVQRKSIYFLLRNELVLNVLSHCLEKSSVRLSLGEEALSL